MHEVTARAALHCTALHCTVLHCIGTGQRAYLGAEGTQTLLSHRHVVPSSLSFSRLLERPGFELGREAMRGFIVLTCVERGPGGLSRYLRALDQVQALALAQAQARPIGSSGVWRGVPLEGIVPRRRRGLVSLLLSIAEFVEPSPLPLLSLT